MSTENTARLPLRTFDNSDKGEIPTTYRENI